MTDFQVKYDRRADVLYVTTERNGPAVAREGDDGIVWRYLDQDGSLVGLTVMDFAGYWQAHRGALIEQMSERFRVTAKRAEDVLEHVHG